MAKIKTTKNGNIQMTISPDQAQAIRDIVGRSNYCARKEMCNSFVSSSKNRWTIEEDNALSEVYHLIVNLGEEY